MALEVKVTLEGRTYTVIFTDSDRFRLSGWIDNGRGKIKFAWSGHDLPWINAGYKSKEDLLSIKNYGRLILEAACEELVSDNHSASHSAIPEDPTTPYQSRLLIKGHLRRPYWRGRDSHRILVAATLVNASKLSTTERADLEGMRDLMNAVASRLGTPVTYKEALALWNAQTE